MKILLIVTLFLCGCTIAPQQVHYRVASSWLVKHRLSYYQQGYKTDPEYVRAYKQYYSIYGAKLPIREQVSDVNKGITQQGDIYLVTFETNRRFDHMIDIERNSP